ncbi:MAG: hypothetical protein AAFX50_23425, partial [Acidobacteriota bacterium]
MHINRRSLATTSLLFTLFLSAFAELAWAQNPLTWRGSWRSPMLQTTGTDLKANWDVDALVDALVATDQNVYAYHVDHAEDLVQIWDDSAACGPIDELGVAADAGSSLQILDALMRAGTELAESDDGLDPDNHTGTKKTLLQLVESTQAAGISLVLQFQKEVDQSCPSSGKWLSRDELTRIGHFMSHLSMAYPHVAGWFIDDFMGYLCDPWDAAGSTCLAGADTVQLQAASEPAAFWVLATSTKAPYVVGGAHVLSAEGVRLRTSDRLDMDVKLHLPDELSEQDLLAAGDIEISFLTLDSDDTDYDPGSHCS